MGLSGCVSAIAPNSLSGNIHPSDTRFNNIPPNVGTKSGERQALSAEIKPTNFDQQSSAKTANGKLILIPLASPTSRFAQANNGDVKTISAKTVSQEKARQLAAIDNSAVLKAGEIPVALARPQSKITGLPLSPKQTVPEKAKPFLFASLFNKSRKNASANIKPVDDRRNSILLSSRTASQSNRASLNPSTTSLIALGKVRSNDAVSKINKNIRGTGKNVRFVSLAGIARLPANGLKIQHSGVEVDCILPEVVKIIRVVERRYGKTPIVTSGYRRPSRNRSAGGARNSMHIYCKALDIQVEGVSKWKLAKFLRSVPGRGGVGTYCWTKSVHIDSGPKRDWNYPCRRKSKRRGKARGS